MIAFLENKRYKSKPQIDMMLETPSSKEIRICMAEGNVMREHTAPGSIIIMVLEGNVSIESLGKNRVLKAGDMIFFEAQIPHSLEAHEDSIIRLSLSKNDTFKRVVGIL
jgi:quercetin dioxygenase-like cupin family protein